MLFGVLAVLPLLFAGPGAWAQAPAPPAAAAAAPLTPQQAQNVLDVLNDPQKRAAFTATLQAMIKAGAAAPKPAAAVPAVPLAPNSIGAQVVARSAVWFSDLTGEVMSFGKVLGNLPAVWAFTRRTFADPDQRGDLLDAAWHLALVVAVAAAVQIGFRRALRAPIDWLARAAPSGDMEPGAPPPDGTETVQRQRRFARLLRALRRLPYALARLLLTLLPVATFLLLAAVGLNFLRPASQDVLWVAITAYVGAAVAVVVTLALVSPDHPTLRVVQLRNDWPAYTVRWVRRLVIVAAFGYAATTWGALYGMPDQAQEAFKKAVALVDHVLLVVIVLQIRRPVAESIRVAGKERRWRHVLADRLAATWHLPAIFVIMGLWLVWAAQVRHGFDRLWRPFLLTMLISIAVRLLSVLALGGIDRLLRAGSGASARFPGIETRATTYMRLLRGTVNTVLWILGLLAILEVWGVRTLGWFHGNALGGQLASAAGTVVVAAVICLLVWEMTDAALERHLAQLTRQANIVRAARLRTLMPILRTVLLLVLAAIFVLTLLSEIGVNVAPLLAGAGILGVAIGFGSQKLVQDFITGIFLLLENAMQVGDWVTVAGLSGSVEHLSIRTVRLRAGDGSVHIVPFSSVSTVSNVNRGVGNVVVSVSVDPDSDTDHVSDVLAEIARGMREEARFADMMRSDFQVWGVDKVEPGAVTVSGQIVCSDSGRWPVQREFNRRLNIRFREAGIRLTGPVQTVLSISQQARNGGGGDDASPAAPQAIEAAT